MPAKPLPHTLLIYELFEIGYDACEIAYAHPRWVPDYVRDVIAKGRLKGHIRRTTTRRGRPPVKEKMNLLPQEIFVPDMQRVKNPVSGEVKLVPQAEVFKYKSYGWVMATLTEFRRWHMSKTRTDTQDQE